MMCCSRGYPNARSRCWCGYRQLEEQQARQEEAEDALHSQQLTGLSLAAQVTALERARAADGEVLACVPQHTSELKEVGWRWCRLASARALLC